MVAAVVMWIVGLQQRININFNHFYWDRWHTTAMVFLSRSTVGPHHCLHPVVSFAEFPRHRSSWHFLQKALAVLLISLLDINLICLFHLHLRLFRACDNPSPRPKSARQRKWRTHTRNSNAKLSSKTRRPLPCLYLLSFACSPLVDQSQHAHQLLLGILGCYSHFVAKLPTVWKLSCLHGFGLIADCLSGDKLVPSLARVLTCCCPKPEEMKRCQAMVSAEYFSALHFFTIPNSCATDQIKRPPPPPTAKLIQVCCPWLAPSALRTVQNRIS